MEVISEEINDILIAAQWLIDQDKKDYEFLISLEPFFIKAGFWKAAHEIMASFQNIADQEDDITGYFQLGIQQAKYLLLQGDLKQAKEALLAIKNLSGKIENETIRQRFEAMWLNMMGSVLQRQSNFKRAAEYFEKSYRLEQQLGNISGQSKVLTGLGTAYLRLGNFDKAAEVFEKSLEIEKRMGNERGQAMVQNSLGGILQRMGDFEEARDAFEKSIELGEKLKDFRHIAMALTSYGIALVSHGETNDGINKLCSGFEIDGKLRNRQGLGIVTPTLVRALIKANRTEEANQYLQKAIAIAPNNKKLLALKKELANIGAPKVEGTIKFVKENDKGFRFGFIVPDSGGNDIYSNEKGARPADLDIMKKNARIRFHTGEGAKGPVALDMEFI